MRILGIDPGTATTGYGVIDQKDDKRLQLIKFGLISTSKELEKNPRLKSIYQQMRLLIKDIKPDIICLERLFFFNNAKTAMAVSEAIGVLRLAIFNSKTDMVEYAPLKVKAVVAKNGRAKKDEMIKVVRKIIGARAPKKGKTHFDNAADALAIAICHAKICQKGGEE